jgi:asparagine synthase (glutamine-hydrolysing)
MCGILAYISNKEISPRKQLNIKNLMKTRGPDNQSYKKINFGKKNLHLFHSRLSILDLNKRSNQPYYFKNYVMIFNGEIYNFKYLKDRINHNNKFNTLSDTEVILYYYDLYKEKCFEFFEGMWSIIIYDFSSEKLIVSRDRFGEKPLFIHKNKDEIIFSSQISYINEILNNSFKFNYQKINSFLHYGYKSLFKKNDTFFKNINHFEKGSILKLDRRGGVEKKKFWKLKINGDLNKLSIQENEDNLKKLLINAVDLRLVSDVPLALNLSGGIDSGAICSISSKILGKKLETFSIIDKDKRYDESEYINATAKDCGVKTNLIKINSNVDFLDLLNDSVNYNHYPVFTITNLIQYYLTSFVKKKGFKVTLSGSGADEIYGGYYDHYLMLFREVEKKDKVKFNRYLSSWKKIIKPNLRNEYFKTHDLFIKNPNNREYVYDNFENNKKFCLKTLRYNFKEKKYFNNLLKNRMANELFHENVPIFMHSEDLNSMKFSIENRSPFLDTKLIEYLFSLSGSHLLNDCKNKFLLRSSLKGILNEKVLNQSMKSGFNASILNLFNFKSKKLIKFLEKDSEIYDYVNKSKIIHLSKNPKILQDNGYSKFMFSFLSIKTFMDRFN